MGPGCAWWKRRFALVTFATQGLGCRPKGSSPLFVEEALRDRAYQDKRCDRRQADDLQPYMVAAMSEALGLSAASGSRDRHGSGYQTAVLAELAESVFSIERIPSFVQQARARLESLATTTCCSRSGDGTIGWTEHAPFDAIL